MSDHELIERGMKAGDSPIFRENKIWARFADEKADVAAILMKIIRRLGKATPVDQPLRALSIGCSDEPQFRILEAAFRGGLYLLDIDEKALDVMRERIDRQMIRGVVPVRGDYTQDFADEESTGQTLAVKLGGTPFDLITLHHSLYYCEMSQWQPLVECLARLVLSQVGAIHIVMMSATEQQEGTTTWLYNHFAEKFFDHRNDQNLLQLRDRLQDSAALAGTEISCETRKVQFFIDDFEKYMAVVWMIMLYPDVHKYDFDQKMEITNYVFDNLWRPQRPLVQMQDSLIISRGLA